MRTRSTRVAAVAAADESSDETSGPGAIVDAARAISLDGRSAATVNGAEIAIGVVDGNVMIDDSTVVAADVDAGNGIIHVIDTVLVPPLG